MIDGLYGLLVVDDQNGVRRLLYETFTDEGYFVRLADGGAEAIRLVSREVPDIVLLDIKMPGMSGLETLAELRKLSPGLLVVMMTAYGELEIVEEAKKLGIRHYITKPFDINEVKMLVKGYLAEEETNRKKLKEIG